VKHKLKVFLNHSSSERAKLSVILLCQTGERAEDHYSAC